MFKAISVRINFHTLLKLIIECKVVTHIIVIKCELEACRKIQGPCLQEAYSWVKPPSFVT